MGSSELVSVSQWNVSFSSESAFSIDLCPLSIQPFLMYSMRARVCVFVRGREKPKVAGVLCVYVQMRVSASDNLH